MFSFKNEGITNSGNFLQVCLKEQAKVSLFAAVMPANQPIKN